MSTVTWPSLRPQARGGGRVVNVRDALHLDEVVAGADRAELAGAALLGALRDRCRVGPGQAAARLGALEVVRRPDPSLDERPRPLAQHAVEVGAPEAQLPVLAHAGRHRARELVDERLPAPVQLRLGERQREQADAAVDVVADAAGGDDAVRRLERGDAADREAVALVDVRHRQRGPDDAGQRGDVRELLEREVLPDRVEQLGVREDARRNAHVRPSLRRDLPERLVDPDELRHRAPPSRASPRRTEPATAHGR